jgi:DNA-directed RNA polymerase
MTTPNEIEHENQLISRGRSAAISLIQEAEQKNYFSKTKAGRYTLQHWMPVFIEALETMTAKAEAACNSGNATRVNLLRCCTEMRSYIELCSAPVLAAITLKCIEDSYTHGKSYVTAQNLAMALGNRIEWQVVVNWWERMDPEIGNTARHLASLPGSWPKYRKRKVKNAVEKKAKQKGIQEPARWSYTHLCLVGEYLLEVAQAALVCKWQKIRLGKKYQYTIQLTNEFEAMLLAYERREIDNAYETHPLIDIPLDWKQVDEPSRYNKTGGYHLAQLRHLQPMCRGKNIHDSVFGAKSVALQNTLQKTAWRIDARVLDVAEKLTELRRPVGSFLICPFDRPEQGGAPPHVVADKELHKEWKRQKAILHDRYNELYSKSVRSRKAIAMAKEYKHKTFFLTWFVDWRGRFYTQQSWLQPQSTDFEKAMLRFREGCRLTSASMPWIYSSIGKAFLGSRVSFRERISWTAKNHALLNAVAEDPIGNVKEWSDADEPWRFLQLCFEWHSVVTTKAEKFWKVPVEVDASASGLQLLSAMRRDPVGMQYANLLPPESDDAAPEDAYLKVLSVAAEMAAEDDSKKHLVRYLQYRSVGKPVVMTAVYGAKHKTFKRAIKEALIKAEDCPDEATLTSLASLIYRASKKVFPAAFRALDWLKKLGKQAHAQGAESLIWNTPTNDVVHCVKFERPTTEVYTAFNGKVMFGDWDTKTPSYGEQLNSFAPSFVHSYDAAVLKESFFGWQQPLSVIHDCVLVLPSDMDAAMDRLRDGFVSVTSGDPLAVLADDLGVAAAELKRLPQGEQSLDSVYRSKYMFN